ncbi:unnamed protein product [Lampetra fluviatilis]
MGALLGHEIGNVCGSRSTARLLKDSRATRDSSSNSEDPPSQEERPAGSVRGATAAAAADDDDQQAFACVDDTKEKLVLSHRNVESHAGTGALGGGSEASCSAVFIIIMNSRQFQASMSAGQHHGPVSSTPGPTVELICLLTLGWFCLRSETKLIPASADADCEFPRLAGTRRSSVPPREPRDGGGGDSLVTFGAEVAHGV